MSRIQGLNDKVTLKAKAITPAITVWKGEKKTAKSAGKNLNQKFRIEAPAGIRQTLKRIGYEEKDGSLYTDTINLVPAYDDELQTFDSKMAAYTASQPLHFCDRFKIHTKFIKDNRNYFQPIEADEKCPVAGTNHKCPKGCSYTGDFYFYIWELLLSGSAEFARLQVHGVKDNQNIAGFLDEVKLNVGSIKTSPFASDETRTYIIYQMSRRTVKSKFPVMEGGERTAKRGTKDDWIVHLNLHPIWQRRYDYHNSVKQLQASNHQPSMRLIEQVHGEEMISDYRLSSNANSLIANRYSLPKADNPEALTEFKQQLAIAYKNNAWTKDGWQAMMLDNFKTTVVDETLDLELLMAIAQSGIERDKWCD